MKYKALTPALIGISLLTRCGKTPLPRGASIMTVEELISVLQEMDKSDIIVFGIATEHVGAQEYIPAADNVYKAVVTFQGEIYDAVVIDAIDTLEETALITPTCCLYHRTGGPTFVSCSVDEYEDFAEQNLDEENHREESIRDGMQRYRRNREP